jgi:fatty acid desaturase
MFIRTIFLLFYVLMFHYFSIISSSLIISIICAIFSGFGYALLCFMPVHEGSHASTSDSPLLWRLFGSIHDFINGASFYTWCHQHFLGHHPFTNLSSNKDNFIAIDPDIYTNEPDIRRIKPYQKWYNRYKWQHWYVPILYGFLALKYRINDLLIVFILKKNGHIRLNPLNSYHFNMFIFGKLFFLFYRIILPCFYISIEKSLLLFFISDFVTSYTLALVFQVNHVISLAKWPIIDKKTGKVNMDWAEMQLNTTVDYAHDSWFTTFFTGALNYQVVHHLFPYISQIHYPVLAPIIKKHCELYGIKYNYLPSFWHALKEHIYYLSIMGHGHADN